MSKTEHTPGPYYAVPVSKGRRFTVNINPAGGSTIATIKTTVQHAEQAMADGKLFAASPKLLEACRIGFLAASVLQEVAPTCEALKHCLDDWGERVNTIGTAIAATEGA